MLPTVYLFFKGSYPPAPGSNLALLYRLLLLHVSQGTRYKDGIHLRAKCSSVTDKMETTNVKSQPTTNKTEARVITTSIVTKSGLNHTPSFDLANFPKSLGKLLNDVPESFEVPLLGGKIKTPGITAKTDNRDRVLAFMKGLIGIMFAGMEVQDVIPATEKDKCLLLTSLQKSGFKFSKFSKIEVTQAVSLWAENKRLKKGLAEQAVIAQNVGLITENTVLREVLKGLKAANLSAITGIEIKTRKELGLPAKKEDEKK